VTGKGDGGTRSLRWMCRQCDALLRCPLPLCCSLDCDATPQGERYGAHSQLCSDGLISRSGWVLLDDTQRPRFDSDTEWPWVMSPPSQPSYTLDDKGNVAQVLRQDW
jgi:hypothetical protein